MVSQQFFAALLGDVGVTPSHLPAVFVEGGAISDGGNTNPIVIDRAAKALKLFDQIDRALGDVIGVGRWLLSVLHNPWGVVLQQRHGHGLPKDLNRLRLLWFFLEVSEEIFETIQGEPGHGGVCSVPPVWSAQMQVIGPELDGDTQEGKYP